jgi:GNAT superfamily N-acetyltransferase
VETPETIIAMARYDLDPATHLAEVAFVVADAWQHRGIGRILMSQLIDAGRARGLRGFTAETLATNAAMLGVFQRSGLRMQSQYEAGTYHVTLFFPEPASPRS